jgi:L-fuconolactonase
MMIVDTHCHASLVWFEPIEALIGQMDRNDVKYAVLVQIRGQYDNDYQFECVDRFPDRLVSVIAVDRGAANAQQLERLKERGARGIRLWASWLDAAGLKLWHTAARLGLSISCNGAAAEFASDQFAALVQSLPNLPIVIEHLGASTNSDRDGVLDGLRRKVLALSRFPNTYMKIHGLGEFATRAMPVTEPFPFVQPIPPRLREAYDAFGAERLMWGSNFPPVSGLEGYRLSLRLPLEQFADIPEAERGMIFGGTAERVYGLGKETRKMKSE